MSLCDVLSASMGNFNSYVCDKYILVDNKIRNRKLPQECIMKYILWNRGRTTALEALYFMEEYWGELDMDVSKQAISQRRMIIDPQAYIDINDDLIREIYKRPEELKTFKGFYLTADDGSIFDLPNYPTVREDFDIKYNNHSHHTATARVSTMVDVLNEFIISSAISNRKYSEVKHAISHLEDAKDKIDLTKTITIYDRGYPSKDLILKTMDLNSYFIIRLKKDTFIEQRQNITTNDEIIEVPIDKDYLRRISDNEIKELAKKQDKIKIRIITIPLSSGEIETLATNVFDKTFTIDDFKQIYNKRWTIETNYDKLKNKLQTENFSGRRKIIIEQDFYSDTYVFNIATIVKHDVNQEIEQKRRNNKKYKYKDYQANFNIAVGLVKKELLNLITNDKEKQQQTITKIIKILQKHLIPIKEEIKSTNREPVDYGHKFTDNNKRSF
ncbi:MAG: IS4 family transposase [Bacilli bacterium]|nr:IS4 family transposase [Bacilli bacterium]MBQ6220201.1 IS4 family transposase [Methanosphaera sp.]